MSRLAAVAAFVALAGLATADDPPPPLPKLPKFKDYTTLPDAVRGKVKSAKDDTLTVVLPEYTLSRSTGSSRSRRPPTVKEKDVEHTLTLHDEALVRWSRKPDRKDDKGRPKPYTPAELKQLYAPAGAPGVLGNKLELAAGQTVEITLLLPTKVRPDELTEQDLRVKWVVIQGAPSDAPAKKDDDKKKDKK